MEYGPCPNCGGTVYWNGKCKYCHPPVITYTVDVICAWCEPPRIIGRKSGMPSPDPTHGICRECSEKLLGSALAYDLMKGVAES